MNLTLTVKQTQKLSPQMVQSMKVLQMGAQELMEYIQEAAQENPVLETAEADSGNHQELPLLKDRLEWLEGSDRHEQYERGGERDQESDPLIHYGGVEDQEENLYSYLYSQLQAMNLPEDMMRAACFITECLNGNGYLDEPLDALARDLGVDEGYMAEVLEVVQSLEPAGIGARNLSECLCLQLRRREEDTLLAEQIIEGYLDALARNKEQLIAKELGATVEKVREAGKLIRTLTPKPGTGFSAREKLIYVVPDLFVTSFTDHFEVTTNQEFFPSIKISPFYKTLMGETTEEEVKEYLVGKVRQAEWMVKSIEQRRSTLMNCAECILERQEAFFRHGPGHLLPMSLRDIAERAGVHESTVSRAIKDKYLQCRYGVYPLSYFFSRGLSGGEAEGGDNASPDAAKALLKKLIKEENRAKPLSDQKLSEKMAEQGCQISRRTVAKYRDEMGIPAAGRRKG